MNKFLICLTPLIVSIVDSVARRFFVVIENQTETTITLGTISISANSRKFYPKFSFVVDEAYNYWRNGYKLPSGTSVQCKKGDLLTITNSVSI